MSIEPRSPGSEAEEYTSMKVTTNCRCCTAGCGVVIEVEGDQIVGAMGEKGHPVSHGYLCPKGHALPWFHHRPDRLDTPRLRNEAATWDEVFTDLAATLTRLADTHGADSIGMYTGTGMAGDTIGKSALSRLIARIGSGQRYSPITVDIAPAWRVAQVITGFERLLPTWIPEDQESTFALWVGCNPLVSHGYINSMPDPVRRIRAFQARGGRLWVADPKATKTAALAQRHLPIMPGRDVVLLAWLLREVLQHGPVDQAYFDSTTTPDRDALTARLDPFDLSYAVARTGLDEEDLLDLRADVLRAGKIAIIIGTGVTFGKNALVTDWLRWVILLATGSLDAPGGMWFQSAWFDPLERSQTARPRKQWPGPASRPDLDRVFGEIPCVAMPDEIEAGHLRALIVSGGSPVTAFPDPARMQRALASLEVLAVADVVETALTQTATHTFAASGQLERMDLLARPGRTMIAEAAVAPGADRKPVWWIMAKLGQHLGHDVLGGIDPDEASEQQLLRRIAQAGHGDVDELFASGSRGLPVPCEPGQVREKFLIDGKWNIIPAEFLARFDELDLDAPSDSEFVFVSGRQATRVNATRFVPESKSRDRPVISINPGDAEVIAVDEGDAVQMSAEGRSLLAVVRLDPSIRPGVVWVSHGWREANVGQLTKSTGHIDRLTGQPAMSALTVTVERVPDHPDSTRRPHGTHQHPRR
jgi:anaerobic selenocysteine-containing dehydrogenase